MASRNLFGDLIELAARPNVRVTGECRKWHDLTPASVMAETLGAKLIKKALQMCALSKLSTSVYKSIYILPLCALASVGIERNSLTPRRSLRWHHLEKCGTS